MSDPSQTATFLFTDIESSTQRWDVDGVGMSAPLAAHDGLVSIRCVEITAAPRQPASATAEDPRMSAGDADVP